MVVGPPLRRLRLEQGRVAQLAERAPEKREVTGSTPVPTTTPRGHVPQTVAAGRAAATNPDE